MRTVSVYEAKTHLSRLLDEVASGETITITRHGTPVAVLAHPSTVRRADPQLAIAALREYRERKRLKLGGLSIREMIDEGRS